ncbi:3-hydroxyacyl-ACP dehydratase FabZ family protein [Trabulsiella odontotermitis]|uniref:3-hydroxyacyl-ACP dehydratase FabZ family protein n=1 Tax=Trabulsiella odontotermitis TaxID=379893 RepID=UPI0006BA5492
MTDYSENPVLPHRYPFLFIDRILSTPEEHAAGQLRAQVCITASDGVLSGRLPVVFPSVLLPEALAQAGGLLVARQQNSAGTRYISGVLAAIRWARFRGAVLPGDRLLLTVRIIRQRSGLVFLYGDVTR